MYINQGVIWLCHKFGSGPWSDAPYNVWDVPKARRVIPPAVSGEQRAALQVLLIDAATGILKVIRLVTFSMEFSAKLHEAISQQFESPAKEILTNPGAYMQVINEAYSALPTSDAMVRKAACSCQGGE